MMRRFAGEDYERFRRKTPFFLPLPKFLTECLTWPTRVLFKKRLPERAGEIAVVLVFYTLVLVGLSVVYARARDLPRIPQAVRVEMPADESTAEGYVRALRLSEATRVPHGVGRVVGSVHHCTTTLQVMST